MNLKIYPELQHLMRLSHRVLGLCKGFFSCSTPRPISPCVSKIHDIYTRSYSGTSLVHDAQLHATGGSRETYRVLPPKRIPTASIATKATPPSHFGIAPRRRSMDDLTVLRRQSDGPSTLYVLRSTPVGSHRSVMAMTMLILIA